GGVDSGNRMCAVPRHTADRFQPDADRILLDAYSLAAGSPRKQDLGCPRKSYFSFHRAGSRPASHRTDTLVIVGNLSCRFGRPGRLCDLSNCAVRPPGPVLGLTAMRQPAANSIGIVADRIVVLFPIFNAAHRSLKRTVLHATTG